MADKAKQTFGQKVRELQASIKPRFAAAAEKNDPADLAELRKTLVGMKKIILEACAEFDKAWDMKDAFGSDFAPDLQRIRQKSENVGRPKKEKVDELAELDF